MSLGYVLQATRDQLWNTLGYDEHSMDVMPDQRPKPITGERFISLYGTQMSSIDPNPHSGYTVELAIGMTISVRTSPLPQNVMRKPYIEHQLGIEKTAWRIINKILEERHNIYKFAQEKVDDDQYMEGNYTGSLGFDSGDPSPSLAGADWFFSDDDNFRNNQVDITAGIYSSYTFNGLRFTRITTT